MSTKDICERGRFVIETGSVRSFRSYLKNSAARVTKYIGNTVISRIEDFINTGDRDSATTLWVHACEVAEAMPTRILLRMIIIAVQAAVAAIATVALFRTL